MNKADFYPHILVRNNLHFALAHAPLISGSIRDTMLHGAANHFPRSEPDQWLEDGEVLRVFTVGDYQVPLINYKIDPIRNGDGELSDGTDGLPDATGRALWIDQGERRRSSPSMRRCERRGNTWS